MTIAMPKLLFGECQRKEAFRTSIMWRSRPEFPHIGDECSDLMDLMAWPGARCWGRRQPQCAKRGYCTDTGIPTSAQSLLTASGPAHFTRATKLSSVGLSGFAWNMFRRLLDRKS